MKKVFLCFLIFPTTIHAGQNKIDSLLSALKTAKEDTNKVKLFYNLAKNYWIETKYDSAKQMAEAELKLSQNLKYKRGIAQSLNNLGALSQVQGFYPQALKYHLDALKIREDIGNKKDIAMSHNNIGVIYLKQNNYSDALKNYDEALKIFQQIGDKHWIAASYTNIGLTYNGMHQYEEGLDNLLKSKTSFELLGEIQNLAYAYNGIGSNYYDQGNYIEALKNQLAALKNEEQIADKNSMAVSYNNIGQTYLKLKKISEAKKYLDKGLLLSKQLGDKEWIGGVLYSFSQLDSTTNNWKDAYEHHKLFIRYRDSLINEENTKKTVQSQMQYEFDKKETLAKADQDKKDAVTAEEKRKQKIITYSVSGGLFLVLLLALFIFRGYRQKQKANKELADKNILIEKSKHIIEEKNKDITDSINYARRIQKAMLPHRKDIWTAFPQSFVLFKPKDIVSGDFYFFHKNGQTAFIASADCTGHGVPGAFMSMVGAGKLNDAVAQSADTSVILSLLNKGIKSALKQSETDETATRDGMDIALCSVDTNARIVKYAGANRPIWIIRNGQTAVEEIKATKKAIGGFTEDSQHFDTHEIKFEQGDTFYISTDGFADTFGGTEQKKVTTKRFKEILVSIQDKTMKEQEQHLDSFIENWKGGTEQIDDILVIGVRL